MNINIDIYSDTICPWCYIGFNKLKSSMSDFKNLEFNIIWRPFQLNPKMPIKGMARQKYLELKFGGKENAKKTYEDIYKAGLINDIHFQFDKITITPNSFYSHKLLALAYEFKKQTAVVETIFYEYFIEGVDIGNIDEIIRIAQQHSIKKDNIQQYLESEEDNKSLLAEETHARSIGVTGLPCFIINKAFVVFGAQDKQYFSNIFRDISSG